MQGLSESIYSNLLYEDRWLMMADGLLNTVKVSLWAILFATLLGGILCAIRMNSRNWARGCVRLYVDLMRAIPLLVLLLLLFYVILADVALSPLWIAIVCFTRYFSAYFCEIFRSGIEGVNRGQWEAGLAEVALAAGVLLAGVVVAPLTRLPLVAGVALVVGRAEVLVADVAGREVVEEAGREVVVEAGREVVVEAGREVVVAGREVVEAGREVVVVGRVVVVAGRLVALCCAL